ncbi:hypothetical protein [Aurantiacibacter luteus]|uniref:Uncharacterized protein n=1 Tax=Aurantiacibacter luteus TaxID=1581420 RepID=A0A0G9MPB9_9SPHN|nr:hypothetical protein [Aurantiacibacter luteus]KLE32444.1 hypothetical protein AAW00_13510 [Aurantiacibacter luteus]
MWKPTDNRVGDQTLRITIDTNTRVPAEDQLRWAGEIVAFIRRQPDAGADVVISVAHLGEGSTLLELVCLGMIAAGGVGIFGIAVHKHLQQPEEQMAQATAAMGQSYGGTRITIECGALPQPLELDLKLVAGGQRFAPVEGRAAGRIEVQGVGEAIVSSPTATPDRDEKMIELVGTFHIDDADAAPIFETDDGLRIVADVSALDPNTSIIADGLRASIRGSLDIDQSGPSEVVINLQSATKLDADTLTDEDDRQFVTEQGDTLVVDNDPVVPENLDREPSEEQDARLVVMFGRIVTTHGGRFAVFRTERSEYRIVAPQNLYEDVPIGEDLRVEAVLEGQDLSIVKWEMIEPATSNGWPPTDSESNFTTIPADQAVEIEGQFRLDAGQVFFQMEDGTYGRVDLIESDRPLPLRMPLFARVRATRGDRGGYADRGVAVEGWTLKSLNYDAGDFSVEPLVEAIPEQSSRTQVKLIFNFGERQVPVFVSQKALKDLTGLQRLSKDDMMRVAEDNGGLIAKAVVKKLKQGELVADGVMITTIDLL